MVTNTRAVVRGLLLVCTCVLLFAPAVHASDPAVSADFDGDGQTDHVVFDLADPSVLRIRLTKTHSDLIVRSPEPLLRVAAVDLDGDHRAELVASGPRGLQIWTKKGKRFRVYHPRRSTASESLTRSRRPAIHETPDEPMAAAPVKPVLAAVAANLQSFTPLVVSPPQFQPAVAVPRSARGVARFAPRPPPASAL
jgi:hypothetical protein